MYERVGGGASAGCMEEAVVPRGHVPVLVGMDHGAVQRFVVPVRLFRDPCMAALLDMGAQEFGYRHQGVLRIPCDVDHFRRVVGVITTAAAPPSSDTANSIEQSAMHRLGQKLGIAGCCNFPVQPSYNSYSNLEAGS
ncbi:hypothetical protein BHE74_00021067 [Ensete ventricosum]|nr:hypothetical protein BHE74_00021067 [Ensete ventricosum]